MPQDIDRESTDELARAIEGTGGLTPEIVVGLGGDVRLAKLHRISQTCSQHGCSAVLHALDVRDAVDEIAPALEEVLGRMTRMMDDFAAIVRRVCTRTGSEAEIEQVKGALTHPAARAWVDAKRQAAQFGFDTGIWVLPKAAVEHILGRDAYIGKLIFRNALHGACMPVITGTEQREVEALLESYLEGNADDTTIDATFHHFFDRYRRGRFRLQKLEPEGLAGEMTTDVKANWLSDYFGVARHIAEGPGRAPGN